MRIQIILTAALACIFLSTTVQASDKHTPSEATRRSTKNAADDTVYFNGGHTFYCDCLWVSDKDNDGSGKPILDSCGYEGPKSYISRSKRIEWEHVVPASLLPAKDFKCWKEGGRDKCEKENAEARAMIYDLHNLVPAIGQVNALRSNDFYTVLDDADPETVTFGQCKAQDARGGFEPTNDRKGDVARIWFYMENRYGLKIPTDKRELLLVWHKMDPVSRDEVDRNGLIYLSQGNMNPFVPLPGELGANK